MYLILFISFIVIQIVYVMIPLIKERPNALDLEIEEEGLTVLIPAYNEELVVDKCAQSIIQGNYKAYEIIIINDGSSDRTLEILNEKFTLEPVERCCENKLSYKGVRGFYQSKSYKNVFVIDKYNGGKADSLNAGIDYSTKPIVITLDADSVLEKNALRYINQSFKRKNVIAVGGMVHIVQGFKKANETYVPDYNKASGLVKHQIIQYLTGFCLNKYTQSCFNAITVIAGAFGAFRKEVLFSVGGFRQTVGEDMDITLKIQKYMHQHKEEKFRMLFVPEALCYTQCPEDFKNLFNQRFRWQRAFIDCIFHYWDDLFNHLSVITSMYFLIDSFILGTLVAFSTMIMPLIVFIHPAIGFKVIGSIALISCLMAFIQNTAMLIVLSRYGYRYTLKDYIKFAGFTALESVTYRFLGIIYATLGTLSYFWDTDGWKKINRVKFEEEMTL